MLARGATPSVTRRTNVALLAGAALAATAACSHAPRGDGGTARHAWTIPGTLRFADGEDVDTLNPLLSSTTIVHDLGAFTMGYFFTFDDRGEPVPSLCTAVPTRANGGVSADGRTLTYHLRRGVRWQDGAPFTAADALFTLHTILDPRVNVPTRSGWDLVRAAEAPDPYTLRLRLAHPYAAFMNVFFTPVLGAAILPKHLLEGKEINHAAYNALPVGLGPFRFVRWNRGTSVEMDAYDGWWGGRPKLQHVVFEVVPDANTALAQLRTHELDAYVRAPSDRAPQLAGIPDVRTATYPTTGFGHLDFNVRTPQLADVRVRRALAHAIDVRTLWRKVDRGSGRLANTPVPTTSWAYDAHAPGYPYDLAEAARELDAAGWRPGPDGIRRKGSLALRLRFAGNVGNPGLDTREVIVASAFAKIGVALEYRRYPTPTFFGSYAAGGIIDTGKYDLAVYAWQLPPDPNLEDEYACSKRAPRGLNFLGYCDPAFDAAAAASLATYDRGARRAALVSAQETLASDVPTVILVQRDDHTAYDDDLTGLRPGPAMTFWNAQQLQMGRPPAR